MMPTAQFWFDAVCTALFLGGAIVIWGMLS